MQWVTSNFNYVLTFWAVNCLQKLKKIVHCIYMKFSKVLSDNETENHKACAGCIKLQYQNICKMWKYNIALRATFQLLSEVKPWHHLFSFSSSHGLGMRITVKNHNKIQLWSRRDTMFVLNNAESYYAWDEICIFQLDTREWFVSWIYFEHKCCEWNNRK